MPGWARALTRQNYDDMLLSYRKHGYKPTVIAAECEVNFRTAKRAWHIGWPPGMPAIHTVVVESSMAQIAREELETERLRNESEHLRAQRATASEGEKDLAFKDAVDTRKQEGDLAKFTRGNALALAALCAKLLQKAIRSVDTVTAEFDKVDVTPQHKLQIMRSISVMCREGTAVAEAAMRLERVRLGKPERFIGIVPVADMSVADALSEIAAGQRALDEARAAGYCIDAEPAPLALTETPVSVDA